MSDRKETMGQTLLVAFVLCLVCSILVAGVAVGLKEKQTANRAYDTERSIVSIAGLYKDGMTQSEVQKIYRDRIELKLVDMRVGQFSEDLTGAELLAYNGINAAKEKDQSRALTAKEDIAKVRRVENLSKVYLVKNDAGQLQSLVLPVRGYGLWGTLYGFIALAGDLNTVVGLGFYDHKETPGLGGEVDNPKWKALWPGKKVYADAQSQDVKLSLIKGGAEAGDEYGIDGLAGATLTSNGVNNIVHFWLGKEGFGPFIANLRNKGI